MSDEHTVRDINKMMMHVLQIRELNRDIAHAATSTQLDKLRCKREEQIELLTLMIANLPSEIDTGGLEESIALHIEELPWPPQ